MTSIELNSIVLGDCIQGMNKLAAGSVDLAFADPPFNIGYKYDVYDDRREHEHYLDWSKKWIAAVHRVLKPDGTFWLAIGDEYAAELKLISQELGFHTRSWVIWYYTFGVNCEAKFTRSHAHLFYFVKDPQQFTFLNDRLENRVPSARQLVYNDARSNPKGRLPDDTWILRPQDLAGGFGPDEDTWYVPRVAGTFKERAGFHGCQMPEQLLGRIIRACSREGEVVLDPFSGSATTLAVAKKLARRYIGFDLSPDYAKLGRARLASIKVGDRLDGAAEPLMSAPVTIAKGAKDAEKMTRGRRGQVPEVFEKAEENAGQRSVELVRQGLISAFAESAHGFSIDRVVADPELAAAFADRCRAAGLPGQERDWNHLLFTLRKAGQLKSIDTSRRTEMPWEEFDKISFASEIALQQLLEAGAESLDEILCDPDLARDFDTRAARFAPGSQPLWYRWAALKLRKEAKNARTRAQSLHLGKLSSSTPLRDLVAADFRATSGLFVIATGKHKLYVGEALNLRERIATTFHPDRLSNWQSLAPISSKPKKSQLSELTLSHWHTPGDLRDLLGYQSKFVQKLKPRWNFKELAST